MNKAESTGSPDAPAMSILPASAYVEYKQYASSPVGQAAQPGLSQAIWRLQTELHNSLRIQSA